MRATQHEFSHTLRCQEAVPCKLEAGPAPRPSRLPDRKPALAALARVLGALALLLPAGGASAGVTLTSLHSFSVFPNGADPDAALVRGSDGYFYGTTSIGGTNGGNGTVFKISPTGALTSLYSFTGGIDGAQPQGGLAQGIDGYFYGTTVGGGTIGWGTVFKMSPNGALTNLYSFNNPSNGIAPATGLVLGIDGYFYGTTSDTVFRITPTGVLTTLYSGLASPSALVQGNDGYFYGTTPADGPDGQGSVFRISTTGALTNLYFFSGSQDGGVPAGGLVQGTDGYFYGTTSRGGTEGFGSVFKISSAGALSSLYSFTDDNDGFEPNGGLVQGSDGYFYGTTSYYSTAGPGTVFKISSTGVLTTLYSFTGGSDGGEPLAGLVQGSDGYFYGTTSDGVPNDGPIGNTLGTVFRISPTGALTTLNSFTNYYDGTGPQAGLVQGSDGYFYGTTQDGGPNAFGTVFRLSTQGTLTSLYSFAGVSDGIGPSAGVVQGSDGYFYGTTQSGGTNDLGTVFRLSTQGTLASLYSFTGDMDGANPGAQLVQGSDGYFYGTTIHDVINNAVYYPCIAAGIPVSFGHESSSHCECTNHENRGSARDKPLRRIPLRPPASRSSLGMPGA